MPSTHCVLATLFTKLRDSSTAPDIWGSSRIILIHKGGKESDQSQFRMISLILNIGKLYHTLESARTLNVMISNGYMDSTCQKAFIEGKIPLAPMGVLAPRSAHVRPSARPPIDTSGNFPAHVSAESFFDNF